MRREQSARPSAIELASPAADRQLLTVYAIAVSLPVVPVGRAGEVISLTEAIRLNGDIIDPSPSPFEALDAQEQQEKIDTAVASMAPDVRAAWNGLAYDGISWSELGRRKGLSDNGAQKRYKPKFLDAFLAVDLDTVDFDTANA